MMGEKTTNKRGLPVVQVRCHKCGAPLFKAYRVKKTGELSIRANGFNVEPARRMEIKCGECKWQTLVRLDEVESAVARVLDKDHST